MTAVALIALALIAQESEQVHTGLGFAGLPVIGYNSDDGLGYGGRVVVYDYGTGQKPYRYSLVLQFFQTTNNVAEHRVIFDAPGAFGGDWRIGAELRYSANKFSPYYGIGNRSERDPTMTSCADRTALESNPDQCPGNPSFRGLRYEAYHLITPQALVHVRREIGGGFQLFTGYWWQEALIETKYPDDLGQSRDSRLIEDKKSGAPIVGLNFENDGSVAPTRTAEMVFGLIYDSRDNEPAPTSGMFHDLSVTAAGPVLGSSFAYGGADLTLRGYFHFDDAKRWVLAGRLIGSALFGEVPFYRLGMIGGLMPMEALGGFSSVRGVLKQRFIGKIKVLGNTELRWMFTDGHLFDQHFQLTAVGGFDAGRVFADWASDGPLFKLAYGATLGLRIAYNENFIIRVDTSRELGGDHAQGFYIDFNHLF